MEKVLGVHALRDAEVKLLRSIVRMSPALRGRWRLDDGGGPFDVLLVGTHGRPPAQAVSARTRVVTLRRTVADQAQAADGDVLHLPIRADQVIRLLRQHDEAPSSLPPGAALASAAAESASVTSSAHAFAAADAAADAADAANAADAATPPPAAAPQPALSPAAFSITRSARLRRWPSWDILRQDASYPPLATLLTKSRQSAMSLAMLSQLPLARCEALLRALDDEGLIQWGREMPQASADSALHVAMQGAQATRVPAASSDAAPDIGRAGREGLSRVVLPAAVQKS